MEEKLLNIGEVARYLGLSEDKVKELVEKGELPAYKIGGVLLRFKREQIEVYGHSRRIVRTTARKSESDVNGTARTDSIAREAKVRPSRIMHGDMPLQHEISYLYTFWERLEDFLYYNDFYILSLVLLALIILAIFGL